MAALKAAYEVLREAERQPIDYSDRSTQAAYVYRYVLGHAEFISEFLTLARAHIAKPLFSSGELRVASLGGGPASELLGLVNYLTGSSGEAQVTRLHYTLIDKEPNWKPVAAAIAEKARRHIPVDLEFTAFNLENAGATRPSLADTDLVIASYFISEIVQVPQRQTAHDSLVAMLKTMKPGTLLLYKDSKAKSFLDLLRTIIRRTGGLKEIFEADEVFTANASGQHGIMHRYKERFEYDFKLSKTIVSKLYRIV